MMAKEVTPLHYCPENGWFGDAMPIYHDGVYHIYFNKPRREDMEDSHGGWGHISTTDFLTYTEHPDAFLYEDMQSCKHIGNPVNSGCVFWGEGKWHAFYAGYRYDSTNIFIRHAVSDDGISFQYIGEAFERPLEWYRNDGNFRDPLIFFDTEENVYRMVFCAKAIKKTNAPNYFSGSVGTAISKDLYHWECLPPMNIEGVANTMECPEIYWEETHKKWVMLYYFHETRIRTADTLAGPWERGKILSPDHFDFMAGRQMFDGKRHIMIGWISRRDLTGQRIPCRCMLFPRELTFSMDGKTPKTRFIDEINQLFCVRNDDITPLNMFVTGDEWKTEGKTIQVKKPVGGTMASWKNLPDTCRIKLTLRIKQTEGQVHIILGAVHDYWSMDAETEWTDKGTQIILDPASGLIRMRDHYEWDQKDEIAILPHNFNLDEPIHLDILRDGEIIEVGLNEEKTMVALIPDWQTGNFAISVQDSDVVIEDMQIWETEK